MIPGLTPYFWPFVITLLGLANPYIAQYAGTFKPIVLGVICTVAMTVCAILTPLTGPEVPAQVALLFGALSGAYTIAKVTDALPTKAVAAIAAGLLLPSAFLMVGDATAQTLPEPGAGAFAWYQWIAILGYGIVARLMGRKKK